VLYILVLEGFVDVGLVHVLVVLLKLLPGLLLDERTELLFDHFQNLGNRALGQYVFVLQGRMLPLSGTVLADILVHDVVVEFERVFEGHVVVDLTALWLDHVSLLRTSHVGQGVGLGGHLAHLLLKESLVVPGCILLLDEALSRRCVLPEVGLVELTHDLVELVHTQIVSSACKLFSLGSVLSQ